MHNSVDVAHVDGQRRTEAHLETARYGDYAGQQTSITLPSIAYRMFSPGREITLFDRYINESPLTVQEGRPIGRFLSLSRTSLARRKNVTRNPAWCCSTVSVW